jgi:hypothetical protein
MRSGCWPSTRRCSVSRSWTPDWCGSSNADNFAGLSEQETAAALDISLRTVQRDWSLARAKLQRELGVADREL